jgi:hypothetical protein
MTESTKEIFEKYEVRKTKDEKAAFRTYLTDYSRSLGYNARTESAGDKMHNVIVGDPARADVVYTAHYDTCSVMPFPNFITPKCLPIYILYQVVLSLIIYIIPISVFIGSRHVLNATGSNSLFLVTYFSGFALLLLFSFLLLDGPANRHTANDNTSGVTLLIDLMRDMPSELRDRVAYIFFDLEEKGTVGSKQYAKRHKELSGRMLVVNFDCVSDGKSILFVLKKNARDAAPKIAEAFESNEAYSVDVCTKGAFYPSDQRNFERGVGVSALNRTKHGLLYMNKIHTVRDTVYDEENIEFLKDGAIKLVRILSENQE